METLKNSYKKSKSLSPVKNNSEIMMCEVILLDPTQQNLKVNINVKDSGNTLFDNVCDALGGILEKDYFGLKFIDKHGQQQWLDLNKPTCKQVKDKLHKKATQLFSFRFKHYPRDPNNDLKQDLSKYLLYLQLRRDLYRGRLVGLQNDQYRLAALIFQAEIGDFDIIDRHALKITDLKILPHINRKAETKIMSIYETFKHLDSQEAERLFLDEASKLETYGVEPVAVKDQKGNDLFVGITYEGVSTFSGSKKVHTFPWQNILKLSFSHKLFMFQVIMDQKKHILGFKCETTHAAYALWKWALDRKCFFTLDRACEARRSRSGGSLFRRKKSHLFVGRSQREITKSCQTLEIIPQPHVVRAQSMMTLMKTSNSRSESTNVNENRLQNGLDGYATLPRSLGRKSYISDSSDEGEISKRLVKDNSLRSKPSPSAIGAVLDFMQALKETPVLQRQSTKNTIQNGDHSSMESDKINEDEDSTFITEMVDTVDRERANLALPTPSTPATLQSTEGSIKSPNGAAFSNNETNSQHQEPLSYSSFAYIFIFSFSIFFGILTMLYLKINDLSNPENNDNWSFESLQKVMTKEKEAL